MLLAGPIASPDCVSYLISVCCFAVSNTGHIAPWLWNMDSCNSQHHIVKEIDMLMIVVMLMFLHGAVAPFKRPYGYEAGYSVSSFSGPDSCSTLTILTQSPCHDMCTHGHSARGSATCASIISPPSMLKRKELFRAIGEATIW